MIQNPKEFRVFIIFVILCGIAFIVNAIFFEIRPYNVWGLSYGTAAATLMIIVALLGLRRRMNRIALRLKLGKAKSWLHVHIYGGMIFLLLALMHSGFHIPKGMLTWWLWFLSIWVTISGLIGVFLQKWIPKLLTSGLAVEVVYERIPELIKEIRRKAHDLAQSCTDPVKDFYQKNIAFALVSPQPRLIYYLDITGGIQSRTKKFEYLHEFLSTKEKDKLTQLKAFYRTKLEIDAHYTLQKTLRWWLYLHVPSSLVLIILLGFHIFAVFVLLRRWDK